MGALDDVVVGASVGPDVADEGDGSVLYVVFLVTLHVYVLLLLFKVLPLSAARQRLLVGPVQSRSLSQSLVARADRAMFDTLGLVRTVCPMVT